MPSRERKTGSTKHLAKMQLRFSPAPGQLSGTWAVSIAGLILQREGPPDLPGVGSGVQRILVLHQLGGPDTSCLQPPRSGSPHSPGFPLLCYLHPRLLSCSSTEHGGLRLPAFPPLLSQVMHPGLWLEIPMKVITSGLTCLALGNSLALPATHLASPLGCLLAS